jgi:uncharacterized membrane protein
MDLKNGFLIIGIILIVISAISCVFGYLIRELWPITIEIYDMGIPYIIGALGVIFLGMSQSLRYIIAKRN